MASSSAKAASIVYHESRTWSLDPTFNNYAKLSIQDVQQLPTYPGYPGVFSILNHPIINVHVMGDVTFVNRKALLIEYEVDDGSGSIMCIHWRNNKEIDNLVKLGQLVSVIGRVSNYRGMIQIRIYKIYPEMNPNAETFHMATVNHLWKEVYSKPFNLPQQFMEYITPTSDGDTKKNPLNSAVTLIHDWLNKHRVNQFTVQTLLADEALREQLAVSCAAQGQSSGGIKSLVAMALQELIKEEKVLLEHNLETGQNQYKFLISERDLMPEILSCIERYTSGYFMSGGLHRDRIALELKHFPRKRVLGCLDKMVDNSSLYQVDTNTYKIT